MMPSQWMWCSARSEHANFSLKPQICLEPSSVNTKPDVNLHKHAVQVYIFTWKMLTAIVSQLNLSQVLAERVAEHGGL